jgi:hypothetical protein
MPEQRFDELPILHEVRDELMTAFRARDADQRGARGSAGRRAPRGRRWKLPVGGLVAAGAAAAAIALVSGAGGGTVTPAPATAAQALERAAVAAQSAPAAFPGPKEFFYVRSRSTVTNVPASAEQTDVLPTVRSTFLRESWQSFTRRGLLRERTLDVDVLTDDPGARGIGPSSPAEGEGISIGRLRFNLGNLQLDREELLRFPTDPRTIYERVRDGVVLRGQTVPQQTFDDLTVALGESPAPADLRAGLFRALAFVPGVELLGARTDAAGREGTAVAFSHAGSRQELIFDPRTAVLLATRTVTDSGRVLGETTYLERRVVGELP